MGFDTFNVGPELEYFYLGSDTDTEVLDHGGYFDMTTLDVADEWRLETIDALESMGIPVEYAQAHEVGPRRSRKSTYATRRPSRWPTTRSPTG